MPLIPIYAGPATHVLALRVTLLFVVSWSTVALVDCTSVLGIECRGLHTHNAGVCIADAVLCAGPPTAEMIAIVL